MSLSISLILGELFCSLQYSSLTPLLVVEFIYLIFLWHTEFTVMEVEAGLDYMTPRLQN
ncbi:uncharacterized protein BO87DRAFT_380225 [Aspergillus neoniger CBS 115656]|uniref:Uncharacterized protein n=1 Tax=Aspergillus neoniger (strain CBS 115656) TaxID=1448310 RepID=A0A318Y6K9_ASPNB|nr:hypothetical protein BO87DRAFT_380225 [Aspergillus neoniger CBS 115656]PYH29926.1 hypothetical protein BO87DRAFT_380225 [Aspergillus neoniger CBS 115656]